MRLIHDDRSHHDIALRTIGRPGVRLLGPGLLMLEAGRALDAEVAEKVMGSLMNEEQRRDRLITPSQDHVYLGIDGIPRTSPPHFSTDIAAAFIASDHVRGKGFRFELHELWESWLAKFIDRATSDEFEARADSPALAICRAALIVVGSGL